MARAGPCTPEGTERSREASWARPCRLAALPLAAGRGRSAPQSESRAARAPPLPALAPVAGSSWRRASLGAWFPRCVGRGPGRICFRILFASYSLSERSGAWGCSRRDQVDSGATDTAGRARLTPLAGGKPGSYHPAVSQIRKEPQLSDSLKPECYLRPKGHFCSPLNTVFLLNPFDTPPPSVP